MSGILSVVLGMALVIGPAAAALALVWLIGGYALASGLLLAGLGLRLWSWQWSAHLLTLEPVRVEVGHPPYKPQQK